MAARGIRDQRMAGAKGHPIRVAKPPFLGRPVMSSSPMVPPLQPANLKEPKLALREPNMAVPSGMPPAVSGPQPVNPAGPTMVQPLTA